MLISCYFLKNEIASIDTGEIIGFINNKVKSNKKGLEIDGSFIEVTHKSSIDEVNWKKNKVDIVIDSSGVVENIKKQQGFVAKNEKPNWKNFG